MIDMSLSFKIKKDYEIDWFSSFMFVLYDAMQKSGILIIKTSEFVGFNIKIYEILPCSNMQIYQFYFLPSWKKLYVFKKYWTNEHGQKNLNTAKTSLN